MGMQAITPTEIQICNQDKHIFADVHGERGGGERENVRERERERERERGGDRQTVDEYNIDITKA